MDLRDRLSSIAAPTLIIAGEDDPATPPDHAALLRDCIPGSEMTMVPDAAHLANIEQPEAVTPLLVDHLEPVAKAAN